LVFIPPRELWKNGYVDSFYSRQQDECMSITTIATILHVHAELTDRHSGYNNIRRPL